MAYIANTAFQPKVSNGAYNGLQNVAGKFYDNGDPAICSAGFIVEQDSLLPNSGYEYLADGGIYVNNGNTWKFVEAADGIVDGFNGDHTGLYACNTYNVHHVVSANGEMTYNLGINTLGLAAAADEVADFTELLVGHQYKFGVGNFASTPTVGQFCEIDDGLFAASSATAPTANGVVYAQVLRAEPWTEGSAYAGDGYVVRILRTAVADFT